MKTCCVEGCNGPDTPNPVYFELPSRRLLRKRWLDAINCPDAGDEARVCIRHFTRSDYELVRGEATLRSRSVPSRRIVESEDEDSESESDSTESTNSNGTQDKTYKTDDNGTHNDDGDNRTINNDNINTDKRVHNDNTDNGKINHDNGKDSENSGRDSRIENGPTDEVESCTQKANIGNGDNRLYNEDDGKTNDENRKRNDDNRNINDYNGKLNDDNGKVNKDDGNLNDDNGKLNEDDGNVNDDNGKLNEDDGKVNDDNGKVNEDDGKVNDDNGKVNEDNGKNKKPQGRKTRCKITALRPINGRRKQSFSSDSSNSDSVSSSPQRPELEGSKEDIEESLQHYYIENKKTERQVAAMADVINGKQEKNSEESRKCHETEALETSEPVFIELSVGQGSTTEEPTESDCLMVLESVQCDVDPALLLAAREDDEENMEQVDLDDDDDEDEPEFIPKKKEDPISLLTSSDEDDVILEEPKYDVVEVSSADTSEDDMPLVKLLKSSTSSQPDAKKRKLSAKHTKNLITKLLWGRNDFYCVHCRFTTANASDYTRHMATHEPESQHKIIQYCQDCGFTTSSKHQMQKHKQKHKNEKRFKCPKCNYSAKHEMSLVYHMKTHSSSLNEVELAICGTYDPASEKSEKSRKSKSSDRSKSSDSAKTYSCNSCGYKTKRRSDLRRHRRRKHDNDDDDDDDDEYVP